MKLKGTKSAEHLKVTINDHPFRCRFSGWLVEVMMDCEEPQEGKWNPDRLVCLPGRKVSRRWGLEKASEALLNENQ